MAMVKLSVSSVSVPSPRTLCVNEHGHEYHQRIARLHIVVNRLENTRTGRIGQLDNNAGSLEVRKYLHQKSRFEPYRHGRPLVAARQTLVG